MNAREEEILLPAYPLRISPEEKAQLEHDAGDMTLSAFIRWMLFAANMLRPANGA